MAQIPGADEAITAAAKSGWIEVFLVVIVFVIIASFIYVLRRVIDDAVKREERLSTRVTSLETEIRSELFSQLRGTTEAMDKVVVASHTMTLAAERMIATLDRFSNMLESRPCLMAFVNHGKVVEMLQHISPTEQQ